MKTNDIRSTDIVISQVVLEVSKSIHRKLYCGEVFIKQEDRKYTIYVKSIYGVKFIKLTVDIDPETWNLRFRLFHDWYTSAYEEFNPGKEIKPLKTILINNLKNYTEKDEIKYIVNYFSGASRNYYKYFRDNLSILYKGKKCLWSYLKFWFKWPKKRPI